MTLGVYLIVADEFERFKIGYSSDVESRFSQIQTGCPTLCRLHDVLVDAGFQTEAVIHALLLDHHVIGEWFCINGLEKAERHFDVFRTSTNNVAEMIAEHVPGEWWDAIKANLYASGASGIANELTNITGQSVMDRRYGR